MSYVEGVNPGKLPANAGQPGETLEALHRWADLQPGLSATDSLAEVPYSLWDDTTATSSVAALFFNEMEPAEYTPLPLPVTTQYVSAPACGTLQPFRQPYPQPAPSSVAALFGNEMGPVRQTPLPLPVATQYASASFQQPHSQPAALAEFSHMQMPQVADNVHWSLSEEEILHIEARRRDNARTQQLTSFPQQEGTVGTRQIEGHFEEASSIILACTDTSNASYNEYRDMPYANMAPALIDGINMYDLNPVASSIAPNTLSADYNGYHDTRDTNMAPAFRSGSNMYESNTLASHTASISPLDSGDARWPIFSNDVSSVPSSIPDPSSFPLGSGSIQQPSMELTAFRPSSNKRLSGPDAQIHVDASYMATSANAFNIPYHTTQSNRTFPHLNTSFLLMSCS
jgi:hypothetical protein